jgi:hypothetical protein
MLIEITSAPLIHRRVLDMAGKIFINYRRDDSAPYALAIAGYLEKKFGKHNIFIDVDHMLPGLKFKTVLENKLRQCRVMLAITRPNWVDARDEKTGSRRIDDPEDWVRLEIERALARNIPVIPVLVAGAALPSKSDLPQSLQPLLDHHSATVTTNGFPGDMEGLARAVAYLTVRRPWVRIAAAASALILGGYVVAYLFGAPVWWPFSQGRPNVVVPEVGASGRWGASGISCQTYARGAAPPLPDEGGSRGSPGADAPAAAPRAPRNELTHPPTPADPRPP